jgi:Tol biopolymer transport system component
MRGRLVLVVLLALATSGCAYVARVSDARTVPGGNGFSFGAYGRPALSADGRYAAYTAQADAAVAGTDMVLLRDYAAQTTVRVDVATNGTPGNDAGREPSISADGRYVAFTSDADNLAGPSGDNNFSSDVFVRDMVSGTTTRVSVSTAGEESDGDSYLPSISADGRYVAFTSDSDLLDADDYNASPDVFVRDRQTDTTKMVSLWAADVPTEYGAWDGVISANGRYVAFTTDTDWGVGDTNFSDDVYMRDLVAATTRRISVVNAGGAYPSISTDGRYVAYVDWNGYVYVRDTVALTNKRVNPGTTAPSYDAPAISGDGRWVAFTSMGNASGTDTNGSKADIFLRDMLNAATTVGSTTNVFQQLDADSMSPVLSADGHYVAWVSPGRFDAFDTNGINDIYMRAVAAPSITGVTPATIARGTTVNLTVSGQRFVAPIIGAVGLGGVGVTVNSATWVNDTTVTLNVTVEPGAVPGPQSVDIMNGGTGLGMFGGGGAQCIDCVTVT